MSKIDPNTIGATLRRLVCEEGLTDRECGLHLGVSTYTAWHWRNRMGIPRADKWAHHFEQKYGAGSVAKLLGMLNASVSHRAVAREFGFSRSYVRQLCTRLRLQGLLKASMRQGPTPMDYVHRYWAQLTVEEQTRFLTEVLTPEKRWEVQQEAGRAAEARQRQQRPA